MARKYTFRVNGLSAFVPVMVFALFLTPFLYASTPPAQGGTLSVITTPERAEVWIDGGYAGLTPIMDKTLTAGTYTLRLVDPSRQKSTSETVVIVDGERLLVERSLAGSYAKLRVDTDPQGADVSISADIGKTPLVNDYLTPGQYKIEIRHPNAKYLTITKDVSFADGQQETISHKLEKPPIFTTKRCIQLGLGAGAALAWTWAVVEQYEMPSHEGDKLKEAKTRSIAAIVAAATLSVGLQVTIFIW
ncbi:MAG: PEGA domain-containing protein [Chitinispirillales bacterium]|nr:PEGA domain-containing protein [Chitinispirillales bacterium]